jgi:hypothetical protein
VENSTVVKSPTVRPFFLISKGILGPGLSAKENQSLFEKVVRINAFPAF